MPAYESIPFAPPAPIARVILRNPADGTTLADVPMMLDSGADVTLVPDEAMARLGAQVDASQGYELMAFDDHRSVARVAELQMIFLNRTFKGRLLLIAQSWGIIGRNVLNHVALLLDGPQLTWSDRSREAKP